MTFPILYKVGETMVDGEIKPIYLEDEMKDIIYDVLRKIWNYRPSDNPPTWGDLFTYTQSCHGGLSLSPNTIFGATMEQVICSILGKPICQTSIDEITPTTIEPNMEDTVKEYFELLVRDDSFNEYWEFEQQMQVEYEIHIWVLEEEMRIRELEEEMRMREQLEKDRAREIIEKETKPASVLKILEGIMDTNDQTLDQGKYLELCNLLKGIHADDYEKIEKLEQVQKELEDEKQMRISAEETARVTRAILLRTWVAEEVIAG